MKDADLLSTYKPSGINTHRTSLNENETGFVEWLEEKLHRKLYLFQRLDAGTSGVLLLAKSKEIATQWSEWLKAKKITKKYLFITQIQTEQKLHHQQHLQHQEEYKQKITKTFSDLHPNKTIAVTSFISKKGNAWVSDSSTQAQSEFNSETRFTLLETFNSFQLWQAEPITGKTHQIRLHAQSLGIPLLGDTLYGGKPFFRLCLHALEIQYPEISQSWRAEAPPFFTNLKLLNNPSLCALLGAVDLRNHLLQHQYLKLGCYRISHTEYSSLRIDCFGEHLWVYDYEPARSTSLIQDFFQHYPLKPTWVREMKNRGQQPNEASLQSLHNPQSRWTANENNLTYELRSDQGLSPGLFLDQRENRFWVQTHSKDKSILNLFSYTCGFSLNAAKGGAKEVVSVDVSSAFLEWGKRNFQLNDLDPARYEFWSADSIEFLKRTIKIQRKFDLIICDPPSFGRSKQGVFNIEKDFSKMVSLIGELLAPKGRILLSTNFEKWNLEQFQQRATLLLPPNTYHELPHPKYPLDFLEGKNTLLKTLILEKS